MSHRNETILQSKIMQQIQFEKQQQKERERIAEEARRKLERLRLNKLESRFNEMNKDSQKLRSKLREVEESYQEKMKSMDQHFSKTLEKQKQAYSKQLAEEKAEREQHVKQLWNQLNIIQHSDEQKRGLAKNVLHDLRIIRDNVDRLPHQQFCPSELEKINREIENAEYTLDKNMVEASFATSQNAYIKLIDLRERILEKEREFTFYYEHTLAETEALLEEANSNRKKKFTIDCESIEVELDAWSDNSLSTLIQRLEQQQKELIDDEHTLNIDRVREIRDEVSVEKDEVDHIVESVGNAIIASQSRYEIGEKIVDRLKENGYELEGAVYEGNDKCNGIMAKVKNLANEEVVVVVSPDKDDKILNKISINWHHPKPGTITQEMYRNRSDNLLENLKDIYNFSGESHCYHDEDTEFLDLIEVQNRSKEKQKTRVNQVKKR